jgi:hypothetical protein
MELLLAYYFEPFPLTAGGWIGALIFQVPLFATLVLVVAGIG